MKKVCLLGDSVAKGVVLDEESGRYRSLAENFAAICERTVGVTVDNLGKFGSTVKNGLSSLAHYFDRGLSCDYMLFEFGGNDCDFDWQAISDAPAAVYFPKTDAEDFEAKYGMMITDARERGCSPVLLSLPPIDAEKYFDTISRSRNSQNILTWLSGDRGFISRWHEAYNLTVFKLAHDLSVPIIDITSCFYLRRNFTELLCADGIHPNAAGHELIAECIRDYAKLHMQA